MLLSFYYVNIETIGECRKKNYKKYASPANEFLIITVEAIEFFF